MTFAAPSVWLLALFPAGVIVAALKDAVSFTIPNWVSGLLALAFLPAALVAHLPPAAIGLSVLIGAGALMAGMAMFALGWCGGGDAKLMAAVVVWLGWRGLAPFVLVTGLAGGALALGLILARRNILAGFAASGPAWLGRLLAEDGDLPYGLAIAVGALAAFPSSAVVAAVTGG
jgi:prepilin peptidase CpaA